MTPNTAFNQYKENSINTASPEELTLMLYNGLIRFIMQGQVSIQEKDMPKAHSSILRAQDIVREFQASLDMKYPISQSLMLLYDYMYRRLIEANLKKDNSILEEVLGFAKELRDTWTQAMRLAKMEQHQKQAVGK